MAWSQSGLARDLLARYVAGAVTPATLNVELYAGGHVHDDGDCWENPVRWRD